MRYTNTSLLVITIILLLSLALHSCTIFPLWGNDKELSNAIKEMSANDGKYREVYVYLKEGSTNTVSVKHFLGLNDKERTKKTVKKWTFTKEAKAQIWKAQEQLDSINAIKFVQLVRQSGFPTKKKIGGTNYHNKLVPMVLHFSKHEKIVGRTLKQAAMNGQLEKFYYMYFYDRAKIVNDEPCLYRVVPGWCKSFVSMDSTNRARHELGLSPLKEQ